MFRLMSQVGAAPVTPSSGTPGKTSPTTKAPAALNFKVSPAVRQKTIDTFVITISQANPDSTAQCDKLSKGSDVYSSAAREAKDRSNLGTTTLADTWAIDWSYAWLMTCSRADDPTKAQVSGLAPPVSTATA